MSDQRYIIASLQACIILSFIVTAALAQAPTEFTSNYAPPEQVTLKKRDCQSLLQHNRTLYHEIAYKGHITNYYGSPEADAELVAITYKGCVKVCGSFWKNDTQTTLDLLLDWILPALGLVTQMPWESNLKYRYKRYHSDVLRVESDAEDELETFSHARDQFYILLVMNQFQLKKSAERHLSPEELVTAVERAIFSRDVVDGLDLVKERTRLARALRDARKRGIVPILLGLGGFFFAMSVAIRKAFSGGEGGGATAFNVGLGLLVGWLPVLYLAAVVDNDHDNKPEFARDFNAMVSACHEGGEVIDIFGEGRGQGRGRWHFGIGQTIMTRIEERFLAKWTKGTIVDWVQLSEASPETERKIELGHWRIIEPMITAFVIVGGTSSGSFLLAYFTPPVGFAWRSASYLTCLCLSVLIFFIDIILFGIVRHSFMTPSKSLKHGRMYYFFKSIKFRRTAHYVLIFLEMLNTLTLCLLVIAMSVGLFNFCAGSAVDRDGPGGGLIILNSAEFFTKYFDVQGYYMIGIMPAMILMGGGTLYLIEQWFTQSFLWAKSDVSGLIGFKRTRRWKWFYSLGGILETGETLRWTM
ncbi:hypothetical protein TWF970_006701 [Orbilia oligospora]|uniref:Uncharacterized protein n=1 Tax=Orbilia oligospora TaxID=2813651 RepID=A0A7C8V895_ORBOL|nr:hypothetical protein TWF970_006701 [Orbilia oligospora]